MTHPTTSTCTRAAEWVRDNGGIAATRVFTRIWLAMVGAWDWDDLPVVPPEILFLPASVPLNIYDFGCWARQTVVALTVVFAHRPARPLPFDLDELEARRTRRSDVRRARGRARPGASSCSTTAARATSGSRVVRCRAAAFVAPLCGRPSAG